MRRFANRFLVAAFIVGSDCLFAPSLDAGMLSGGGDPTGGIDASLVGTVDQGQTNWPKFGCGPTAAVNSFIFLQNQYPEIYGNKLVAPGQGVATANTVGQMMNTDKAKGTFWSNFILGKMAYLNKQAPGSTSMSAMYDSDLLELPANTQLPATVTGDPPTPEYLIGELKDKEDVEILFQGDLNHYVTLTSITFDTDKNKGTISYIDPIGGKLVKDLAIERFDAEHPLFTTVGDSEITLAVSESPIFPSPEPSVLVLLISGGATCILVRGRQRAGQLISLVISPNR